MATDLIQPRRRIDASFDLTPLIDVVFQLLIFLMISSQFKKPETTVELPQVPSRAVVQGEERPDTITIAISEDGELSIDAVSVGRESFAAAVRARVETGAVRAEIRGDRESRYGLFVEIMEEARGAGIENIGIVRKARLEAEGVAP